MLHLDGCTLEICFHLRWEDGIKTRHQHVWPTNQENFQLLHPVRNDLGLKVARHT